MEEDDDEEIDDEQFAKMMAGMSGQGGQMPNGDEMKQAE